MTSREQRLTRLLTLRTKLHDVAAVDLRAANGALSVADTALEQSLQRSRDARNNACDTLQQNDQHGWLLACADAEFSKLGVVNSVAMRVLAAEGVKAASAMESEARRDRKQMEATLESLQQKEAVLTARAEQQHLDEVTRLLSTVSLKSPFSRAS